MTARRQVPLDSGHRARLDFDPRLVRRDDPGPPLWPLVVMVVALALIWFGMDALTR